MVDDQTKVNRAQNAENNSQTCPNQISVVIFQSFKKGRGFYCLENEKTHRPIVHFEKRVLCHI